MPRVPLRGRHPPVRHRRHERVPSSRSPERV